MAYGLTIPAPEGPVNPAEVPVAELVLDAACIDLHDPTNYNQLYQVLGGRHENLKEELHQLLSERTGNAQACVMAVAS